jgi:hypothetical protein
VSNNLVVSEKICIGRKALGKASATSEAKMKEQKAKEVSYGLFILQHEVRFLLVNLTLFKLYLYWIALPALNCSS